MMKLKTGLAAVAAGGLLSLAAPAFAQAVPVNDPDGVDVVGGPDVADAVQTPEAPEIADAPEAPEVPDAPGR